jgi:site-specific recombinase XerD
METEITAFLISLKAESAYSESTQLAYANDLRVFLLYLKKILDHPPDVSELNTERVVDFILVERRIGRRRNTLIRRLATLKYFRDYLIEMGRISPESLRLPNKQIQKIISEIPVSQPAKCLTLEQIEDILAILDASPRPRALRDRAILMLLLETGLSVGDLTALDLTDLDLRAGRLHVYLSEKGDVWISMGEAKTPVERYLNLGRPELLHHPGEPALFISQMDGRLSRQGVWQILNHWGRMANPPISLSPRLLRHTAALGMHRNGLTIPEIQIRLGHRNPLSTKALIRRLENVCGGNP